MGHARIVLVAVCCLRVFTHCQTAEELVDKNIQAKGGMEKIKAIHSLQMTGKLTGGGGFRATVTQDGIRRSLGRETVSPQGMTGMQTYDSRVVWEVPPCGCPDDADAMGD